MFEEKKFLDQEGVKHLWSKISMEDYPNNETLIAVLNAIDQTKADKNEIPTLTSQLENDSKFVSEDSVEDFFKSLNSDRALRFYCIEDVTVVTNGNAITYPANSNVEVKFLETDTYEIIPTSDNSILQLSAFPGALRTYYSWLEGVKQFSNILFDMNNEEFYSKWSQGNQGSYQVQYAQYSNCIFWSDNAYISDVSKRTNYTLYYTSQLPLCYSSIPDNTFKAFYLAFNVNSDPNWGNPAYRDSFAKATWATQAFSYYGARTIGVFGHDDPDFNIVLPKDCRGLMYQSTAIENAGTFDAINVTNFGAKSGSWRDAFGQCSSLRNLFIKNLKVNLNISWSPINYESIYFIISTAANEKTITISVSPYTYNLLSPSDFELAASKNITIELITTNYIEDKRLSEIANKADKNYVDNKIADLVNSAPETLDTLGEIASAFNNNKDVVDALDEAITNKQNKISDELITEDNSIVGAINELAQKASNSKDKDLIVTYKDSGNRTSTYSVAEIKNAFENGRSVIFVKQGENLNLLEVTDDFATFYIVYINQNNKLQQKIVALSGSDVILEQDDTYDYATITQLNNKQDKLTGTEGQIVKFNANGLPVAANLDLSNMLLKTAQTLTDEELAQVRSNLKFIGKDVEGQTFTIDGTEVTASANAEIFGDYESNIAVGQWSIAEGSGTIAKGRASHAEGAMTQALADGTHTEGYQTKATGFWSHAEGEMTVVSSYASHAEGSYCTLPDGTKRYGTASGYASHIEGGGCYATSSCSHAEGLATTVSGAQSHAEGRYTIAAGGAQHVEGIANIEDAEGKYIHIAGNGTFDAPSNAYTLDWSGNAWHAGTVEATGIILKSSTPGSNKRFKITIDDDGVLSAAEIE